MIRGTTKKARENAMNLVDSMIDLSGYAYNDTPWNWLARIYETTALELECIIKRTPRAVAEERCIWWAFKVLSA